MSESCLNFEVNLEGDIIPQIPEENLETGEPVTDSLIGKENVTKESQPLAKLLSFGFLLGAQEEVEDSVPLEITTGPISGIENDEELASPGATAEEEVEVPPLDEPAKAVISPSSSPRLRPNPMSPARSILSMFQKGGSPSKTHSHVYQEESQLLEGSDSDDDRSLEEAHTAEQLLGSTMRFAEEETGENFFSLTRAPRHDTIELGQRVSTLPGDKQRSIGRTPSILLDDDDASIQSWASQATETSFIKVEKAEPGSFSREYWGGIVASMSLDMEDGGPDVDAQPSRFNPSETKSPPRSEKATTTFLVPPTNRKWDKLRNTLEAQEKGVALEPERTASRFKKSMSLRVPKIGKGPQHSVDGLRQVKSKDEGDGAMKELDQRKTVVIVPRSKSTDEGDAPRSSTSLFRSIGSIRQVKSHDDYEDFSLSLGPLPPISDTPEYQPQIVDGPSDVRISVEDLSKADATKPDTGVDRSTDDTVASRESDIEGYIEESMEVLYIGEKKSWLGNKGRFKTEIQG